MHIIASILSLIGLSAAVYLSRLYYAIHDGTSSFQSLCNLGSAMNCDAVTSSKYAELVSGIPLSSIVVGWFAALFLISLFTAIQDWRKEACTAGLVMTGFACLHGLYLMWVMFAVLKTGCLFCLTIDAVNFLLFGYFFWKAPKPLFKGLNFKRLQNFGIVSVCLVFVSLLLLRPIKQNEEKYSADDLVQIVNRTVAQTPVNLTIPAGTTILGNPNAPVTLVEFSDFQCPYCRRGAVLLNTLLSRYPNDVKVVFLNFPLDQACHRQIERPMHPFACQLARGGACAEKIGKFKPYYEAVFEKQAELTGDSALKSLVLAGMNEADAKSCLESEEAKKLISSHVELGIQSGVQSTPTFFANGYRIEGLLPMEAWDQLIAKLKK